MTNNYRVIQTSVLYNSLQALLQRTLAQIIKDCLGRLIATFSIALNFKSGFLNVKARDMKVIACPLGDGRREALDSLQVLLSCMDDEGIDPPA